MDIESPLLICFAGLLLGAALMWVIGRWRRAARDREALREAERRREHFAQFDVRDTANQLRFLDKASLYPRRPINAEAFRTVFAVAERALAGMDKRYRLLAEVSMGSFLGTERDWGSKMAQDLAFASINSKRVDFLVIDAFGNPRLVIEYQGSGHYQGDAEDRDAVKRAALKRAGIPLLEIHAGAKPAEVGNRVRYWLRNN